MAEVRHRCLIYEGSPASQLEGMATLLRDQLDQGARCVYLHQPEMIAGMRASLSMAGVDVDAAVRRRSLILSSEREHLSRGYFDASHLLRQLRAAVAQCHADGYEKIWITGDMTWELDGKGGQQELHQYELALEQVFQRHPSLFGVCQYHAGTLPSHAIRDALCTHRNVYLNQTLFRLNPYYSPETAGAAASIPTDLRDLLERFHQHG